MVARHGDRTPKQKMKIVVKDVIQKEIQMHIFCLGVSFGTLRKVQESEEQSSDLKST